MRSKIILAVAAAALVSGPFGQMATAQAAQISTDTTTYNPNPGPAIVRPLDCHGTTGDRGCGPGWFWNGNHCVPC